MFFIFENKILLSYSLVFYNIIITNSYAEWARALVPYSSKAQNK